jgi:hypothetical protein
MNNVMRYLAFFTFLLTCFSCHEKTAENANRRNGVMDESVIKILMDHYGVDPQNPSWSVRRDSSEVIAEFRNPELFTDGEEFPESEVEAYSFPTSEEAYMFGDLNDDGRDEILRYQEVMGATGPAMLDIFIFEGEPGAYRLLFNAPAFSVSACDVGTFEPHEIVNGEIVGVAKCFAESDPRCCPSLAYRLRLKWNGQGLDIVDRSELKLEE